MGWTDPVDAANLIDLPMTSYQQPTFFCGTPPSPHHDARSLHSDNVQDSSHMLKWTELVVNNFNLNHAIEIIIAVELSALIVH